MGPCGPVGPGGPCGEKRDTVASWVTAEAGGYHGARCRLSPRVHRPGKKSSPKAPAPLLALSSAGACHHGRPGGGRPWSLIFAPPHTQDMGPEAC